MNRRRLLKQAVAIPFLPVLWPDRSAAMQPAGASAEVPLRRVRPSDPAWPSAARWEKLNQDVGGQLITVRSPLAACEGAPGSAACTQIIADLRNPYYIGDQPGATQTSGWVDAWMSAPSAYAVAARHTADVVAAVNFAAREQPAAGRQGRRP